MLHSTPANVTMIIHTYYVYVKYTCDRHILFGGVITSIVPEPEVQQNRSYTYTHSLVIHHAIFPPAKVPRPASPSYFVPAMSSRRRKERALRGRPGTIHHRVIPATRNAPTHTLSLRCVKPFFFRQKTRFNIIK